MTGKTREREREKRLKEWISRPKHKKPVALGHPPNRWDVFLATSGDTIPCATVGLFGRDTTAFKRLNSQVVSSTLVLEEPIYYASQIYSHQFSKETFHADGFNSNQFSAISSVTLTLPQLAVSRASLRFMFFFVSLFLLLSLYRYISISRSHLKLQYE